MEDKKGGALDTENDIYSSKNIKLDLLKLF